jgi:hypothetical protein
MKDLLAQFSWHLNKDGVARGERKGALLGKTIPRPQSENPLTSFGLQITPLFT